MANDLIEELDAARIVLKKRINGSPEPEEPEVTFEVAVEAEDRDTRTLRLFNEEDARDFREKAIAAATEILVGPGPSRECTGHSATGTVIYSCTLPPRTEGGICKNLLEIDRGIGGLYISGPGIKEGEETEDCDPEDQIMVIVLRIPKEEMPDG